MEFMLKSISLNIWAEYFLEMVVSNINFIIFLQITVVVYYINFHNKKGANFLRPMYKQKRLTLHGAFQNNGYMFYFVETDS